MYSYNYALLKTYSTQNLEFADELCQKVYPHGFSLQLANGLINHYRPNAQANGKQFDLLGFLGIEEESPDFRMARNRFNLACSRGDVVVCRKWSANEPSIVYPF